MTATANLSQSNTENNLAFSQTLSQMMGTQTMLVSPGLAKSWLGLNKDNRGLNERHIARLSESMSKGDWKLNGQGLVFSKEGLLLDGQHRLHAIIKADKPVMFDVRFGVDSSAMMTIDEGKRRNAADVLQIKGVKNATAVSAACKVVMTYDNETSENPSRISRPSNVEVFNWLSENPEMNKVVSAAVKYYNVAPDSPLSASRIAGFMFICNRSNKEMSEEFFYKLSTGVGLQIDGVVFKLRSRLSQAKNSTSLRLSKNYVDGLVATAWNHYVQGNSPGNLKHTPRPGVTVEFK